MICLTLCANPDCSAFFDSEPVLHRDRDTGEECWLCQECAKFVASSNDQRYEPLAEPQPNQEDG